jgi:tetratricopeptide (TPR) repeat protein
MKRFVVLLASLVLILPGVALAAGGGGGGGSIGGGGGGGGGVDRKAMNEKMAARSFDRAKRHLDEAKEKEAKLASVTDAKDREELQDDIKDDYEDARDELKSAVKKKPDSYAGWSELGFSQRKLGDFEDSLEAYDKALELKPSYTPAIEYRGEAYLELGKLIEARSAWQKLSDLDGELADQLLGSMQHRLARQKEKPSARDARGAGRVRELAWEKKVSDLALGWCDPQRLVAASRPR